MNREAAFANYVLDSVRKDLDFLKAQQYLTPEAYNTIVSNLPSSNSASPAGRAMPSPAPGSAVASSPAGGAAPPPPSYQASTGLAKAEALYDFTGSNPQDLSFRRGDLITVTEYVNNDWWRGSLQGKTGLFPSNYVEKKQTAPPPPPPAEKAAPPPPPPSGGENNSYGGAYPPPPSAGGYGGGSPYGGAGGSGYSAPPPAQSYGYPPPPAQQYAPSPVSQGAPPPAVPAAAPPAEEHKSGSKWSNMASKVGGNVANAATWGFGATLGSEAAHSIF